MDGGGGDWGSGRGDETLEELDLVEGSFGVSGSGFDDFESDVSVHSGVNGVSLRGIE